MKREKFEEKYAQALANILCMRKKFNDRPDCEGIQAVRSYYAAALKALEAIRADVPLPIQEKRHP